MVRGGRYVICYIKHFIVYEIQYIFIISAIESIANALGVALVVLVGTAVADLGLDLLVIKYINQRKNFQVNNFLFYF